jgi:hypothetical protein
MDGKAMIVCMSRRIAVDLYNALIKLRPEWAEETLKVVMTGSAEDGPEWQKHIRSKEARRKLAKSLRASAAERTGGLPRFTTCLGRRTEYAGLPHRTSAPTAPRRIARLRTGDAMPPRPAHLKHTRRRQLLGEGLPAGQAFGLSSK